MPSHRAARDGQAGAKSGNNRPPRSHIAPFPFAAAPVWHLLCSGPLPLFSMKYESLFCSHAFVGWALVAPSRLAATLEGRRQPADAWLTAQKAKAADKPDGEFPFSEEAKVRQNLVLVALGKEDADLLIHDVRVLNVFAQIWLDHQDIVIKGKRIAWVGDTGTWTGKVAKTIDGMGQSAVPGFGESHKHIESTHLTPEYEGALCIPCGNTWTVEASHEFSNVNGAINAEFWMKARRSGSIHKIFLALGSATPPTAFESGGGYYALRRHRQPDEGRPLGARARRGHGLASRLQPQHPGYQRMWEVIQATWDTRWCGTRARRGVGHPRRGQRLCRRRALQRPRGAPGRGGLGKTQPRRVPRIAPG